MVSTIKLSKEVIEAGKSQDKDILLSPVGDNLFTWKGIIRGPCETPYENGNFLLDLRIPSDYPISPPKVKFMTKIFHPNIHFTTGEICLDILKPDYWTPAWWVNIFRNNLGVSNLSVELF